ncbi:sialidase family protein [Oxalobacteraceae bacterium R-40]|uniref:Sialidase family protein n=1 Tax=Keguizhuia sedimenti TaxID=3064264 RepID=A0ABU1BPR6_9BURK|nr:sialidase family protein [Oxalobacteraceae bacterium R-40]
MWLFVWAILIGVVSAHASDDAEAFAWQAIEEIAAGNGEKGSWRQNDSRYDYVDDPAVAMDERGNIAVAWVEQKRKDVIFRIVAADDRKGTGQKIKGKEVTQAVNISRSPDTFSWLPRIVYSPRDPQKIFIIWQEIIFSGASHGGEIFFARSGDGGKSFGTPVNVSHSFGGDGKGRINKDVWHNGSYDLAVGPDGSIYVVWTEYDGMLWIARSRDGGKRFSEPRQLAGSRDQPARGPSIAVGREGAIYLAWTTGETDAADILIARSDDQGASFSAPQAVGASATYSDAPKLAVDSQGCLHLAYAESDGDAFGNYHVRYTRSFDGASSFEEGRSISAPLPAKISGTAFPSIAVGAGGTVVLTSELYPGKNERPRGLGIAVSSDGGRTFGASRTVPGSADPKGGGNGSHQGLLMEKVSLGADGTLAIVNSSLKPGSHSRVWLMRGKLIR